MVASRKEIYNKINELAKKIPPKTLKGPPFAIFYFVTSVKEGYDVEIGFTVTRSTGKSDVKCRKLPQMKILTIRHVGTIETISQSYNKLYSTAYSYGLISDEFCREVYTDWNKGSMENTEIHFIIHDWHELLARSIEEAIDKNTSRNFIPSESTPAIDCNLDERFRITKALIEKIDGRFDDAQKYDIVSRCAHKFPKEQIAKLRIVYQSAFKKTGKFLNAIDAVIDFMDKDPGWGEKPIRKGNIIYASKAPRDPKAFEKAATVEEKRKAYCFCPIIRERLDKGMPVTFCYCGAGWYRQQWEGAIGKPVSIKIIGSILNGDERCQFAVHLPEDL